MDYHILKGSDVSGSTSYQIAFHIPVPDQENAVGVNYRAIIAIYEAGPSVVPNIGAEQDKLDSGELYEDVDSYVVHEDSTTDHVAFIEAWYTEKVAALTALFGRIYRYTGKKANV